MINKTILLPALFSKNNINKPLEDAAMSLSGLFTLLFYAV
jgi:hypothetical protein